MNIFTKLRRLREAIEEVYPIGSAVDIIDNLMDVLETDRASISFHLGDMCGDVAVKIIAMNQAKLEDTEQEEDVEELRKLHSYYDAKLKDLYDLNKAIIDFLTAFCNTKELD